VAPRPGGDFVAPGKNVCLLKTTGPIAEIQPVLESRHRGEGPIFKFKKLLKKTTSVFFILMFLKNYFILSYFSVGGWGGG
jgi:hypothetical protein